jgi:hypothetical protein
VIYVRLMKDILKHCAGATKDTVIGWLKGWMEGVTAPTPADYNSGLEVVRDLLIQSEAARAAFLQDPRAMGVKMRTIATTTDEAGSDAAEPPVEADPDDPIPMAPEVANDPVLHNYAWDKATADLARATLLKRANIQPGDILKGLKALGFTGMGQEAANALLTLYWHHADIFLLRKSAGEKGMTPVQLHKRLSEMAGFNIVKDSPNAPVVEAVVKLFEEVK